MHNIPISLILVHSSNSSNTYIVGVKNWSFPTQQDNVDITYTHKHLPVLNRTENHRAYHKSCKSRAFTSNYRVVIVEVSDLEQ